MWVCMYVCIFYHGHAPSRVWAVTERRHENKGVAGAGRPPSLLAVAISSGKSLRLPLDIIRKRALAAQPCRVPSLIATYLGLQATILCMDAEAQGLISATGSISPLMK